LNQSSSSCHSVAPTVIACSSTAVAADTLPPADTRQDGLRVILLVAELPADLVGFASTISGALAERNVPIILVGTASRDHLLVPEAAWPEALAVLRGLRDASRRLLEESAEPPADADEAL
jgi:hypothetical protein